ncbi:bystin [Caerostris extrusa]|uniref:Bystin n=1 Tax=Caerostris extrusa TaxID=172846 RepID=A0AAV4PL87_CAEEX|nr:bystin [Caerostris extrusa]
MDKSNKRDQKKKRHNPLYQQITEDKFAKSSTRVKVRNRSKDENEAVDSKLTEKIISEARKQLEDVQEEVGLDSMCKQLQTSHLFEGLPDTNEDEELENPVASNEETDEKEELEITEEIREAFNKFDPQDAEEKTKLAEALKENLTGKLTEIYTLYSDVDDSSLHKMDDIVPIYKDMARLMSIYRSGRYISTLEPFRAIPKFHNWEKILFMTEPENWTAAAMYEAVRIFSAIMKEDMAQRFYNIVLLPRLRDEIAQCKQLNHHLYRALKRAIFQPCAFYRGIIIPLCESQCTLREATIFGSVLAKCTIPMEDSAAALVWISRMPFNQANCIILRVLIEKKYALPYKVGDYLVTYFLRFLDDKRPLPLIWHQCLLTFAQIYKNYLTAEQQQQLLKLLTVQPHKLVSPEVRKELLSATLRPPGIVV